LSIPLQLRREHVVVSAIWLLGLASLASVLVLQERLDQRRQAQLAVASLRLQVSALPKLALGLDGRTGRQQVQAGLATAEAQIGATAATLDGLAGNRSDAELIMNEARAVFPLLATANAVASSGHLRAATLALGLELVPGAPGYRLNETFSAISAKYNREASSAQELAEIGSSLAIVLLLAAFSTVLWRASRLAREKHRLLQRSQRDALTDELTGLWNRRKLFIDLDDLLARPESVVGTAIGILDLDGFKAYNDRFGHPAGDALLSRIGQILGTAVAEAGSAYRMGGDEFCLIARGPNAVLVLERARASLTESVGELGVGCSLGSLELPADGSTADELLRKADLRLYDNKRSTRAIVDSADRRGADQQSVFAA
jgi:diguanylate cyclase (GGDEF)-like protein